MAIHGKGRNGKEAIMPAKVCTASNWIDANGMQRRKNFWTRGLDESFQRHSPLKIHKILTLSSESQMAGLVWLIQFKALSEAANLLAIDPMSQQ